jgi:hypothetical protein
MLFWSGARDSREEEPWHPQCSSSVDISFYVEGKRNDKAGKILPSNDGHHSPLGGVSIAERTREEQSTAQEQLREKDCR